MYHVKRHTWLALYLASHSTRLDYKQVWASEKPRSLMLGVWQDSKRFPREEALRIQAKVERFLSTSPLIGCKNFIVRVPGNSEIGLKQAKGILYQILGRIKRRSFWMFDFFSHKVNIMRDKKDMSQTSSSHISSIRRMLLVACSKSFRWKNARNMMIDLM